MRVPLQPCPAIRTTPVGDRILKAASRLFYEHGITATGVDLIVAEAQTTKRTLYERFGSKDALVAAYLQQRAHDWQTELLNGLAHSTTDTALNTVYRQAQSWATAGGRGCAFANAWSELAPDHSPGADVVRDEKRWMLELFTLLAHGDPELGTTLHMLYEGAQISAAIHHNTDVFSLALETSHRLLVAWHSIRRHD